MTMTTMTTHVCGGCRIAGKGDQGVCEPMDQPHQGCQLLRNNENKKPNYYNHGIFMQRCVLDGVCSIAITIFLPLSVPYREVSKSRNPSQLLRPDL